MSPERLKQWFDDLNDAIKTYKILPENMYNIDESGFSIGEVEASRCIINASIRQKFQKAVPGCQEWVTSVESICADGTALPPLIIFKVESLSRAWIPVSIHKSWCFSHNSRGWTSNLHGLEWLDVCFDPAMKAKARALICDGHDSHITGDFIEYCMENNILLLILPPHSSHLTQPLDVGVFKPLKMLMALEIELLLWTGVSRVQKVEWTGAFVQAHEKAFSEWNIKSGFHGTGIHPFLPTKVLNRVAKMTPPPPPPPQDMATPSNPFNDSVLTSSPIDIDAVRVANQALNTLIHSGEPIPSPAKKYFGYLTRSSERKWARQSILEQENEDLKGTFSKRKSVLSGKRKAVDGKSLISNAETLNDVRAAERATKERGQKKRKVTKKRGSTNRIEPSDGSEVNVDGDMVEILDCIEVQS